MMARFLLATALSALMTLPTLAADELPADLAAVPADALGFAHIRVADIWKSDALKELRETVMKAGDKALTGFDRRFLPSPSSIDRLTVVAIPCDVQLKNEPEILAILAMNKPFEAAAVLKSAMPNATEKKTTNGSYWTDVKSGTAVSIIKDQIIVFGKISAVELYIEKRSVVRGELTESLQAANTKRHITIAANLSYIPKEALNEERLQREGVPPFVRPLLLAKTALLSFNLAENNVVDLSLNFENEQSAAAGMKAVTDMAQMGRDAIKKSRAEMLNTVLGDGTTAPLEKLPESAMALLALGGMERLDEFLMNPPVKQDGKSVKMSTTIPNIGYASTMPIAVGLLLPAVQKVRAAASRVESMNNLKQIGLAMHSYHDAYGKLPSAAICSEKGKPLLSWRVAILPFIEQQNLYEKFKLDEPWDSENNKKLIPLMPKTYSDKQAPTTEAGMTHYRIFWGKDTIFTTMKESRTLAGITDGSSNTMLAFEAAEATPWTKPDEFEYDAEKPLPKFASFGGNGFLALWADGSVRTIPLKTHENVLRAIITAAGGETVDLP